MHPYKKTEKAPYQKSVFFSVFMETWWVFLCVFSSILIYSHAATKKDLEYSELQARLSSLEQEKHLALELRKELKCEIESQDDPAWVELALMKGLGVVPEGYRKVYFTNEK